MLGHLDSIIVRQIEEIDLLVETKPRPVSTLQRSRAQLNELMSIRNACEKDDASFLRYLDGIEQDMLMVGWDRE